MCGRYTHNLTWQKIVNLYRLTLPEEPPEQLRPSFNVAPTHVMPLIRPAGNGREMFMAGWSLIAASKGDEMIRPAFPENVGYVISGVICICVALGLLYLALQWWRSSR
jgi:putative SOS response-associated peptidase YedK